MAFVAKRTTRAEPGGEIPEKVVEVERQVRLGFQWEREVGKAMRL